MIGVPRHLCVNSRVLNISGPPIHNSYQIVLGTSDASVKNT